MAPASSNVATTLPAGQYKVVSIALDLTGKKLIDEICHVGAYAHPEQNFSQYVMPFRDVSQSSVRTHDIKVITTFGKYRVLKEASSMRTLKTKSEYSTLCDFMAWLKETKGESDGILLVFHDNNRHSVSPFLLEALNRYKILDDFFKMCPGFVNVCKLAEEISEQPDSELKGKNVTLRALAKNLLSKEEMKNKGNKGPSMKSAKNRARYTYLVLQKLMKCESEIMSSETILGRATNREYEMENLERQKIVSEKFHSLKPLFVSKMRKGLKERTRAVALRRHLIDGEVDYQTLKQAFEASGEESAKEAITAIVEKTPAGKKEKEKEMEELVQVILTHFKSGGEKKDEKKGKEMGQGDPGADAAHSSDPATSASSTESDDEEFEEAHDEVAEK